MFILQETPINTQQAKDMQHHPSNGALLVFEGMVRADELDKHTVNGLLYIADSPAVKTEGEKIIGEALSQFKISKAICIQRIGQLEIGETAIWIGVWAAHRDEAYKGSRYIIEEVKKRLLIWKKESFSDGSSAWVQGKPA